MATLCKFSSPEPSCFISVTADNRIKLWNVRTNSLIQEFTEKNHLAAGYTCLAWHSRIKSKDASEELKPKQFGVLALGTARGAIVVWDLRKAEVLHTLGEGGSGHSSAVKSVVFSPDGSRLLSCAAEKKILEWDLKTGRVSRKLRGDKMGTAQLSFTGNGKRVVAVGTKLVSFDFTSGERQCKFDAHTGEAGCLAAFADGEHVVSSSSDRFVTVWRLPSATASEDDASSAAPEPPKVLVCPSKPVALDTNALGDERTYRVLAASMDGQARLWQFNLDSERKKKPLQAACTLKPAQKDWAVLSAVFQRADSNDHVIVAQGGAARPMFRVTAVTDEEHELISEIELPAFTDGHGLIVPEVAAAKSGAPVRTAPQSISVLGPAQQLTLRASMDPSQADPLAGKKSKAEKKRARAAEEAADEAGFFGSDGGASDPDMKDFDEFEKLMDMGVGAEEDEEASDDEATLQERLKALRAELDGDDGDDDEDSDASGDDDVDGDAAASASDGEDTADAAKKKLAAAETARVAAMLRAEVPKASSLSALLIQALQANDAKQLELCLSVVDDRVIDETVARIPLAKVVAFLNKIIEKFEASPSRGLVLTRWIRSVLLQHTAHLMSVPGLVHRLSGLYQTIDARLTVFKPLLKLSGRLDLVLSQVAQRGAGHNQPGTSLLAQKVVHADDASDAEEGELSEAEAPAAPGTAIDDEDVFSDDEFDE